MHVPLAALLFVSALLQPATAPAGSDEAEALARAVMKAHGADVWPKVTRIRFTFHVEREGKPVLRAAHDWDVRGGTDTVTWGDKRVTVDVKRRDHEGDAKQAYARFINDTYWLLAPLKVMDGGVNRSTGPSESIDGQEYRLLHLSFDAGVGLTPADQYNFWVNPQTSLVEHWDYIPAGGQPMRASRGEIRDFDGLKLSTKFVSPGATIRMTNVEVVAE